MLEIFNKWYRRYLFEEESVLLLVLLTVSVVLLMTIGDILAPVLAAIVLAYLAQGLSTRLQKLGLTPLVWCHCVLSGFCRHLFWRDPGPDAAGMASANKPGRGGTAHA